MILEISILNYIFYISPATTEKHFSFEKYALKMTEHQALQPMEHLDKHFIKIYLIKYNCIIIGQVITHDFRIEFFNHVSSIDDDVFLHGLKRNKPTNNQ